MTDAAGSNSKAVFDPAGNGVATIDPEDNSTKFAFDALGPSDHDDRSAGDDDVVQP